MKYAFILSLSLTLVGCSDSPSTADMSKLKHDLRFTTEQLESCQSSLSMYRNSNSGSTSTEAEPQEEAAEPTISECEFVELYVDNKLLATCDNEHFIESACGIGANGCSNGYAYSCLQNIKYKSVKQTCKE